MDEEDIVYEPCSKHTSVQQNCEWCKIATMLESMLEEYDLERSEKIDESARKMATLMD